MATASLVIQDRERSFLSGQVIPKEDLYVLNHATKYLARDNTDDRHNLGRFAAADVRARIAETWRFPIIDGHYNADDPAESYRWNEVTFVYRPWDEASQQAQLAVSVVGTFMPMYQPIPLHSVPDTPYYTVSVLAPKGELHFYKYIVNGQVIVDPINPQISVLDNGVEWSRFFTQGCTRRICFEIWEMEILMRLTDHILPFRTPDGQLFLQQYYQSLDRQSKEQRYRGAYRFDESVGVANFIDKIIAREENHHLTDYKICLGEINRLLRQRNPFVEIREMSREMYVELYDQMASGNVPGWNYQAYGNPRFFLQLLRRHTLTGAFAHPKYCGNSGASGWAYLSERYRDAETGMTLFDWRQALERPLGTNEHYRG
jgi:hypothetical protein